jgi:hemerythrin superfamily protein
MDMSRFQAASRDGADRGPIANTLIREMAIHSDAEETSIYNEMESFGFEDVAAHNRGEYINCSDINNLMPWTEEHAQIKKMVYEAYHSDIDHPEYDTRMSRAVEAFLAHAQEEERDELPKLKETLSAQQSDVS